MSRTYTRSRTYTSYARRTFRLLYGIAAMVWAAFAHSARASSPAPRYSQFAACPVPVDQPGLGLIARGVERWSARSRAFKEGRNEERNVKTLTKRSHNAGISTLHSFA